jgi:hypothetical protein
MAGQLNTSGAKPQIFDTGSTLLIAEDPRTNSKLEVNVDHDDLRSDEDEIELSFKSYKDGQQQIRGVTPHFTLLMKQEQGTWRLSEVTLAVRVALADPEFLKGMTESMKRSQSPAAIPANTSGAVRAMRTILTAEVTYASTYPGTGYTCSLSDLDGFGGGDPNEHQAMLIESRLASGKKYGYIFAITGCSDTPSSTFQLTAVPAGGPGTGRSFCADPSGLIRYHEDGTAASCLAAGKPLP